MNKTLTETGQNTSANDKNIGTIYRASGNLFVAKQVCRGVPRAFIGCKRNSVIAFSADSGRRMRRYLRECLAEYKQMVTLTYPCGYPTDGAVVKEHLRRFLQELKREQERHNLITGSSEIHSSFWFLEFQERGAPHFHIFTTYAPVPRGTNNWVALKWYSIVNSEDERHLQAGTRTEFLKSGRSGTISYASKYAAKQAQKVVPENYQNVGRWWGVSGRRAVMSAATYVSRQDAQKSDIKSTINTLGEYMQRCINNGLVEVFLREPGVFIAFVHDLNVMRNMRKSVSLLACKTMKVELIFDDAELSE